MPSIGGTCVPPYWLLHAIGLDLAGRIFVSSPLMTSRIRDPKPSAPSPALVRARRLVADMLLTPPASADDAASVPGWKAWLFAAWVVTVVVVYCAHVAGVIP
jgi:hypothetical protein